MKKLTSSFILFFITISIYSQTMKIIYEERANIDYQLRNEKDEETRKRVASFLSKPTVYILIIKNDESQYILANNVPDTKENQSIEDEISNNKVMKLGTSNTGLYKNHSTGSFMNEADIFGKKVIIKDSIINFNWEITDETKTIGNFVCKKATAVYNNNKINAWFTDKIPVSEGPYIYGGLPGLIIELDNGPKIFAVTKIEQTKEDFKFYIPPTNGKTITQKEYDKKLNDLIDELKAGKAINADD